MTCEVAASGNPFFETCEVTAIGNPFFGKLFRLSLYMDMFCTLLRESLAHLSSEYFAVFFWRLPCNEPILFSQEINGYNYIIVTFRNGLIAHI